MTKKVSDLATRLSLHDVNMRFHLTLNRSYNEYSP